MLRPGQGQVYWHVLFHDHPQVRALAREAHQRLAGLRGLDLVPLRWLHLTTLIAGFTDEITAGQLDAMTTEATRLLARTQPITVTLRRVLYHPEAIALRAEPVTALDALLRAARAATRAATGRDGALAHQPWTPHVTVAYSNSAQPAAPVIAALGRELPPCEVTISSVSLVIQEGPENLWNWRPIARIPFGLVATG